MFTHITTISLNFNQRSNAASVIFVCGDNCSSSQLILGYFFFLVLTTVARPLSQAVNVTHLYKIHLLHTPES